MKKALGRGLDTLIPEKGEEIIRIDIKRVLPNPDQPRKIFDDKSLLDLSSSIKEKGVLQPLIVQKSNNGKFIIISGERRWRATMMAGQEKIPCVIRQSDANDSLEVSLIENIQREDLNPMETAEALNRFVEDFNFTQEEIAKKVGKERATVANYLRLVNLPIEIKQLVKENRISMGHAKTLLSLTIKSEQLSLAKDIVNKNLSVRETEKLCKHKKKTTPAKTIKQPDSQIASLESELTGAMGTKVRIIDKKNKGKIEIEYYSLDELNRLLDILRK